MTIECPQAVCTQSMEDKFVYFGVTTTINFNCIDDVKEFKSIEEFQAFFNAHAKAKAVWQNNQLELKSAVTTWNGDVGRGGSFDSLKPAFVCVYIDLNGDETLDDGEPTASDRVDLGLARQTIESGWRK